MFTRFFAQTYVLNYSHTHTHTHTHTHQIITSNSDVVITNDGATILKQMEVTHPCAKMVCLIFSMMWIGILNC
jgi:hypothetical protein